MSIVMTTSEIREIKPSQISAPSPKPRKYLYAKIMIGLFGHISFQFYVLCKIEISDACFIPSSNHGPTTNGLITGVCLWSHHDRRHLIMCILMSTFTSHDNVDYVITNVTDKRAIQFTSNSFRWSAISGYASWLRASWWGAANPKLWKCVWYKIDYYRSGHWRTCIWPCLKVRDTCPLLSLHLIILEYVSDHFKTEVVNHDNSAKFTGLSCKLHIFAY